MIVGSLDHDYFTISSLFHTGLIIHERKLRNSFSKSLTPMVSNLCQSQWCNMLMFISGSGFVAQDELAEALRHFGNENFRSQFNKMRDLMSENCDRPSCGDGATYTNDSQG